MLRLEPRPAPSRAWTWGSPLLALTITVVIGVIMFAVLGKDPAEWSISQALGAFIG